MILGNNSSQSSLRLSPPNIRRIIYALLVLLFSGACDSSDDSDGVAPNVTLSAEPDIVALGQSTLLSWSVEGTEPITLTIAPAVGDVSGTTDITLSPTETTTYTLTASNVFGTATKDVTVTVDEPVESPSLPVITSFTTTPNSVVLEDIVLLEESVLLGWTVEGTEPITLTITPNVGDVSGKSNITLFPMESTIYTLTARNAFGAVTETVGVPVGLTIFIGGLETLIHSAEFPAGGKVSVYFNSSDDTVIDDDVIYIVPEGGTFANRIDSFAVTSVVGVGLLTTPDAEGDYEIRYHDGTTSTDLTFRRISITPALWTIDAPPNAEPGGTISVAFTRPNSVTGDRVTLVVPGMRADEAMDTRFVDNLVDTAGSVQFSPMPSNLGTFEVRYVRSDGAIVATDTFDVIAQ